MFKYNREALEWVRSNVPEEYLEYFLDVFGIELWGWGDGELMSWGDGEVIEV